MKIGIHHRPGSFSDRWIEYCKQYNFPYKLVNCYENEIINQLIDCNGLMWHWHHLDYRDILFARQLTISLERIGKKVFPNSNTAWHFNDKIGQKYLLDAIGAPLVSSYVFYEKKDAMEWSESTEYPKVFKLSCGASSLNVKLVKNKQQAKKLINKAFGNGFSSFSQYSIIKDRLWQIRRDKNFISIINIVKSIARLFIKGENYKLLPNQKGYVYFQDFIPNNTFDNRLVVIGNRCFGIRRFCRKSDFRASGSGVKEYDHNLFDKKSIEIAFNISKKIGTQSLACDFIYQNHDSPLLVEISYGFITGPSYDDCDGYWDDNLNWHNEKVNPQYFIIEDFIRTIEKENA